jgi:hypothetical protein
MNNICGVVLRNAVTYIKLLSTIGFLRPAQSFLIFFGFLWLLLEPAGLFFPNKLELGWNGYSSLIAGALLLVVIFRFPRQITAAKLSSPDSIIEIKIGDLFDEAGHLVIGTNDVFDTKLGDVIKPSSLQGQFLTRIYNDDSSKLNGEIERALERGQFTKKEDELKKRGKQWRYPIGTTITLGTGRRRYFFVAYSHMGNDLKSTSNADAIWHSLSQLWEEIRLQGQGTQVAIPVIGADLARTNLPRMTLIKMIIISFIVASKEQFIAQKLVVVLYPPDLNSINLYDLHDFLVSACF